MTVSVVHTEEIIPDSPIHDKPTLVYWNIVGLALPIRLVLAHLGVDFEDVRIDAGDPEAPDFCEHWSKAKAGKLSKAFLFPNLPYFMDEHVKITQTNTVLRHIARKYGLPCNPGNDHLTDLLCDQLTDLESTLAKLAYGEGPEALLKWYKEETKGCLLKFSEMLRKSDFLTGERPTIGDFKVYSFLHKLSVIQEDLGSPDTAGILTSDLEAFMKRIEELPNVKQYLESTDHMAKPVNSPEAKWVGK
jgi:glutathione S-transferase